MARVSPCRLFSWVQGTLRKLGSLPTCPLGSPGQRCALCPSSFTPEPLHLLSGHNAVLIEQLEKRRGGRERHLQRPGWGALQAEALTHRPLGAWVSSSECHALCFVLQDFGSVGSSGSDLSAPHHPVSMGLFCLFCAHRVFPGTCGFFFFLARWVSSVQTRTSAAVLTSGGHLRCVRRGCREHSARHRPTQGFAWVLPGSGVGGSWWVRAKQFSEWLHGASERHSQLMRLRTSSRVFSSSSSASHFHGQHPVVRRLPGAALLPARTTAPSP